MIVELVNPEKQEYFSGKNTNLNLVVTILLYIICELAKKPYCIVEL